jgi:hypothetical protein
LAILWAILFDDPSGDCRVFPSSPVEACRDSNTGPVMAAETMQLQEPEQ